MSVSLIFNPLLEEGLQYVTIETNYPEVATYADLPVASTVTGQIYYVDITTGSLWTFNKKSAGLYRSNGSTWISADIPSYFSSDEFRIQDSSTPSKQLAFNVIAISSSTTRTITMPDADVNLSNSYQAASGSNNGYLSSTNWSTFNNKQDALGYTPVNKAGDSGVGLVQFSGLIKVDGGVDVTATGGSDILNIGTTNADVINIGNSGSVLNFLGTAIFEYQANQYVTDKLITLNYGGAVASGIGVGFEIEENSIITGYFKTNGSRNGYSLKTPAIAYYLDLSLASLTADRVLTAPDASGTIALTSDLSSKQDTLVSGTNIKTINGTTLLGSGDLTISSGVSSVTGTTNRITSSGGTTPVIDISSLYGGQSSIVTVGTLTGGATGAGFTVALTTSTITGLLTGTNGGTGVNNGSKTITLGGNLTTTGAFNPTFSIPQTTTWTFPNTANETLAGLGTAQAFTAAQTFTSIATSGVTAFDIGASGNKFNNVWCATINATTLSGSAVAISGTTSVAATSGNQSGGASSGVVSLTTGNQTVTNGAVGSGNIPLTTGNVTGAGTLIKTSGSINLVTGNVTSSVAGSASGSINLTCGTSGATRGSINIGNNATSLIGMFGVTAIIQPANTVAIDDALINLGLWATGGATAKITKTLTPLAGIVGVTDASSATTGIVGEEIISTVSTYTNYTTTVTYQNITSITLTAGDWDIDAFATFSSNASTITAGGNAIFAIATTTASATGAVEGKSIAYVPQAALLGTSFESISIPGVKVSISGSTTYYFTTQAAFTIGNPQYTGTIRARRLR